MRQLVLGGVRSGKSSFAEALASRSDAVEYVATSPRRPDDPEWNARIAAHVARRPASWRTIETLDVAGVLAPPSDRGPIPGPEGCDALDPSVAPDPSMLRVRRGDGETATSIIPSPSVLPDRSMLRVRRGDDEIATPIAPAREAFAGPPGGPIAGVSRTVLVDCLTLWLSATMDRLGCWDAPTAPGPDPLGLLEAEMDALAAAVRATTRDVILVSNEVGQGIVPATASGRLFRDRMGLLNLAVAAACDEVWFLIAGLPQQIKG